MTPADLGPFVADSSVTSRFWARVDRSADCWEWRGAHDRHGYGRFFITDVPHNTNVLAHRYSYVLNVGPIPAGLTIDHLCRNQKCVNPAHLEPVTAIENIRRWVGTITHCKRGHALTPENVYRDHGRRACRRCNLDRAARARRARGIPERRSDQCQKGHPYPQYRSIGRDGWSSCRECHRLGEAARRARLVA